MKEKRYHLAMDERERSIMIHALNDYQSRQCAGQKGSRVGKETG